MTRAHWFGLLLLVPLGTSGCLGGLDECDIGATSCSNGSPAVCQEDCSDLSCTNKWQLGASCGPTQTCIAPSDAPPMCVESPTKDPLCAGSAPSTYCSNQQLALCDHGYRTITRACGSVDQGGAADLPGGPAATVCVDPGNGAATCVPEAAKVDSLCDGVDGPHCEGTTLVACADQYAVFKTSCASCTVESVPRCDNCPPTPHGVCHGYLGDGCAADNDCAAGLVCHDTISGQRICSLACAVEATGDPSAAPTGTPNAQCYAAFNPDGTAVSGYSQVNPGGRLGCIAGYCEWEQ